MELLLDWPTLATGLLVFLARVVDVTTGTMRTISIVQGRMWTAFVLGLVEVTMWLIVISAVLAQIATRPILGVFYALGFSTGNVVGILLERRLALGHLSLRVISVSNGPRIAKALRDLGLSVTSFQGEGKDGPVTLLYAVCGRRQLRKALDTVQRIEPTAFYSTEMTGHVSKLLRPIMTPTTGWRSVFKKK
jgi:uncharacterized protein YebE (UPF0316 family)